MAQMKQYMPPVSMHPELHTEDSKIDMRKFKPMGSGTTEVYSQVEHMDLSANVQVASGVCCGVKVHSR